MIYTLDIIEPDIRTNGSLNMKYIYTRSPIDVERKFNEIKNEINKPFLREDSSIPPTSLFDEMDQEFREIEEIYRLRGDTINLLHVKHNYLWCKAIQSLESDTTASLLNVIDALKYLLDRDTKRPYDDKKIDNMLGTYMVLIIKIERRSENINVTFIEGRLEEFIEEYSKWITRRSEILGKIMINLVRFLIRAYEKDIETFKITPSKISDIDILANKIRGCSTFLQANNLQKSLINSEIYELLYKLRKKELHSLCKTLYFETDPIKATKTQNIVEKITEEMIEYSNESYDIARKTQNENNSDSEIYRIMLSLKEIDKDTAQYYFETYHNKDAIKGWGILDDIRLKLIKKAFQENIPLSEGLLSYYEEEWTLLETFNKIYLLKKDIEKISKKLGKDWETEVFTKIISTLEELTNSFRYVVRDEKTNTLKIVNSGFSGKFTEYFVHQLCLSFYSHHNEKDIDTDTFAPLLKEIVSLDSGERIRLNDIVENGKPDLDILIGEKLAILFKNSKIESKEMKGIWEEMEICRKRGISVIYYAINFAKNISKIEYIRKSFERIRSEYNDIKIFIVDIEELADRIIRNTNTTYRKLIVNMQKDMLKMLDY